MKTIQLLLILAAITTIFSNKMKRVKDGEEQNIIKAFADGKTCEDINGFLTKELFKRLTTHELECKIDCAIAEKTWNAFADLFKNAANGKPKMQVLLDYVGQNPKTKESCKQLSIPTKTTQK